MKNKLINEEYNISYWKHDRSESLNTTIVVRSNHAGFKLKCNHDIALCLFLKQNPQINKDLIINVCYC